MADCISANFSFLVATFGNMAVIQSFTIFSETHQRQES